MDRKNFLRGATFAGAGLFVTPAFSRGLTGATNDPLPPEKVKEFVIAGHGDMDKVKSMLAELPTLLYATWDWGNGDFETALEGAGHVGNKDMAHYLIDRGARTNLFVLTMLGQTQIVKPFLEKFPQYLQARGPHGLTFYHHAQKGGEQASELLAYFTSKGHVQDKMDL